MPDIDIYKQTSYPEFNPGSLILISYTSINCSCTDNVILTINLI